MVRLQHNVSPSLKQALERLKLSENTAEQQGNCRVLSSPFYFSPLVSCMSVFRCCPRCHRLSTIHYHPLLVTVDRKVALTGEVNGWPLGVRGVWAVDAFFRFKHPSQFLLHFCLSFFFLEEDNNKLKIGTSCKNAGCTKVGECVCCCILEGWGAEIYFHGFEMSTHLYFYPCFWRDLAAAA